MQIYIRRLPSCLTGNPPPEYNLHSQQVLEAALNEAAAYETWRSYDPGKKCPIDFRYASMPALTKEDIRRSFPSGLLPAGKNTEQGLANNEIAYVQSSGSADDSVTNIWNQQWWDSSEKASWKLNNYTNQIATGNHHEAILVNPLNVGILSDDEDLPLEKRRLSRFLYLNERQIH